MFDDALMIHMPGDTWKLSRMSYDSLPFKPLLWNGVDLRTQMGMDVLRTCKSLVANVNITKMGNFGAALSHIAIWNHLAQTNRSALVFEDNAIFLPNSMERVNATLGALPGADFVNFAVLRPSGTKLTHPPDTYSVPKPVRLKEPLPNVWHSSYYISARGATRILEHLRRKRTNFNKQIIDRVTTMFWSSSADNRAYIVNPAAFGHKETSRDSRKRLNSLSAVLGNLMEKKNT